MGFGGIGGSRSVFLYSSPLFSSTEVGRLIDVKIGSRDQTRLHRDRNLERLRRIPLHRPHPPTGDPTIHQRRRPPIRRRLLPRSLARDATVPNRSLQARCQSSTPRTTLRQSGRRESGVLVPQHPRLSRLHPSDRKQLPLPHQHLRVPDLLPRDRGPGGRHLRPRPAAQTRQHLHRRRRRSAGEVSRAQGGDQFCFQAF